MFGVLFGDITSGRLLRLPYLGYSILIGVLGLLIAIGIGASLGIAERLVGGDIQQAQEQLREQFGIPAIIIIGAIFSVLFLAHLNLMAKRIRDMGLPGWWMVLALFVAAALTAGFVSQQASGAFNSLTWLALLLIPTGMFGGQAGGLS